MRILAPTLLLLAATLALAGCPRPQPTPLIRIINESPYSVEALFLDPDPSFPSANLLKDPVWPWSEAEVQAPTEGIYRACLIEHMTDQPDYCRANFDDYEDDNWYVFWRYGTGEQGRPSISIGKNTELVIHLWVEGQAFGCTFYYGQDDGSLVQVK
jgi:hypothetical protein